jgi:hypothetical protein
MVGREERIESQLFGMSGKPPDLIAVPILFTRQQIGR